MFKKSMVTSQDIAVKFMLSYQTINHYTNLGILIVKGRKGNIRLYDEEEVRRNLQKLGDLKNEGYPLRLIRKML